MPHTVPQTAGDLDLGSESADVHATVAIHRMPLLQSAGRSVRANAG